MQTLYNLLRVSSLLLRSRLQAAGRVASWLVSVIVSLAAVALPVVLMWLLLWLGYDAGLPM